MQIKYIKAKKNKSGNIFLKELQWQMVKTNGETAVSP